MRDAEDNLDRLVQEVREGIHPEVVITVDGVPVARIVPYHKPRRVFGLDRGLFTVPDDFDDPVPVLVRQLKGLDETTVS